MDDEGEVIAQAEALQQLIAAMRACDDVAVPRMEIVEVVRPHLIDDDDIAIEGSLMEHLGDSDAAQIIEIVYETLLSGATFSFVDGRRTRKEILDLCTGIEQNVRFTRDRRRRRVWITKPPS